MQGTLFIPHLSSSSPEARCFLSHPPCHALLFPGTKQNKNSFCLLKCIEWLSAFQPFSAFSAKTTCRFEFEVNILLFLLNAVYYFAFFFFLSFCVLHAQGQWNCWEPWHTVLPNSSLPACPILCQNLLKCSQTLM